MVKHKQIFIDSLIHPKKLAAYRLLTIGKTIQYVFLLIAILTIYPFVQFLTGVTESSFNIQGLTDYVKDIQWLLYPFALVLLTLSSTVLIFIMISIYAYVGVVLLKIMNRRGEYRHMWRTAALAITWSTLLSVIFSILNSTSIFSNLLGILITISILIIATTKYPKIPKK